MLRDSTPFGKGRVNEERMRRKGKGKNSICCLSLGLITKATCGRFVDKRAQGLISKFLVIQTGRTRVIATVPTGMKRGLDIYHSALIASSIVISLTLAFLAK